MIKSEIVEIPFTNNADQIINELSKRNIIPLRWAVVKVSDKSILVSVSYQT